MAKSPPDPSPAAPPVTAPPPAITPLPPEILQAAAPAAVPAATAPKGPAPGQPTQRIGRPPGVAASPLVLQAEAASAPAAGNPGFSLGVPPEQKALRAACANLVDQLGSLLSQVSAGMVICQQALAAVKALPGHEVEAPREGIDLPQFETFMKELEVSLQRFTSP